MFKAPFFKYFLQECRGVRADSLKEREAPSPFFFSVEGGIESECIASNSTRGAIGRNVRNVKVECVKSN